MLFRRNPVFLSFFFLMGGMGFSTCSCYSPSGSRCRIPKPGGAAPPCSICSSSCRAQLLQHPGRHGEFQFGETVRSFSSRCEKQMHP